MRYCKDCGKEIWGDLRIVRCSECNKLFIKNYNKIYKRFKPASAISKYYFYYKFVTTLTNTEISVIIGKRKNDIRHTTDQYVIKVLRTYIKILCDVYDWNILQNNDLPDRVKAYEDDCERQDILRYGKYEDN